MVHREYTYSCIQTEATRAEEYATILKQEMGHAHRAHHRVVGFAVGERACTQVPQSQADPPQQRPTGGTCCVSHSPRAFLLLAKVALVIILQVCKHPLLWACSRHETTALHNKRRTLPTCSFQVNSQLVFHCSHQVKVLLAREQAESNRVIRLFFQLRMVS